MAGANPGARGSGQRKYVGPNAIDDSLDKAEGTAGRSCARAAELAAAEKVLMEFSNPA